MTKFKYNGKIWNPKNPEKKLKQLGITWNDVEIIEEVPTQKEVEYEDPNRLFYFINPETGYSITSINPITKDGYIPTTYEYLKQFWNGYRKTT